MIEPLIQTRKCRPPARTTDATRFRSGWRGLRQAGIGAAFAAAVHLSIGAEWEALPPLPEPNGGFVCEAHRGKVVVAGGTNWQDGRKRWLKQVHVYDPKSRQWSTPWQLSEAVAYGIGGQTGRGLVFAAGSNGAGGFNQTVWIDGKELTTQPALPLPKAAVLAAGGVVGSTMIVAGGTDDAGNLAALRRDVFLVNLDNRTVAAAPAFPGPGFATAAAAVLDGRLWIFGGANWDAGKSTVSNSDAAHAFSIPSGSWRQLKPLPFVVRGLAAIAVSDRLLYLAGGYRNDEEEFTDEAVLYDIIDNTYLPAKPLPYQAMVGLVNCDGYIYCLGGEDRKQHRSDACFRIPASELARR